MTELSLPVLYNGSVKRLLGQADADNLYFQFTDDYSIYDWGKMPNQIPDKGKALSVIATHLFEYLAKPETWLRWNVPTNLESNVYVLFYLRELRRNGLESHFIANDKNLLNVKKVDVHWPEFKDGEWSYTEYHKRPTNCLVPLEVVFRHGIPMGSSLPKRLKGNRVYAEKLGIFNELQTGHKFTNPVIEFSSKLEETDRYLDQDQAKTLSGMSEIEFASLHALATLVALRLKDFFAELDLELWDGKFEFAFVPYKSSRKFILVDCLGPDEIRLTYKGLQLSKESLRQFYIDSNWLKEVNLAKAIAHKKNLKDWKQFCALKPEPLSTESVEMVADFYRFIANKISHATNNEVVFQDHVNLEQYLQ